MYKIYTSEGVRDRNYVEHTITQADTSSNFSVHQNFHTVGGLIEGQEPFVVALTSAGLYQFTIFGPDAGKMEGPFKVKVSEDLTSLPQRVVRQMNTKVLTSIELTEEFLKSKENEPIKKKKIEIGASVGSALVVLIVAGFLVWRRKRRRRQQHEREEEEERKVRAEKDSMFVGKHEVYSDGLIPESESSSFSHTRRWSNETIPARPRLDARIQNHTHQDQMRQLELSSHPRPNIITSVAES